MTTDRPPRIQTEDAFPHAQFKFFVRRDCTMSDVETICTFTLDNLFLGINVGEVH